ncbi:YdhK family protein [Marinicrinis lubricantis]|uniref:YdhK family protein n=1 Tax=Marinicrinis lubricantis TaxID=2086470 RepID=A0ABW1ISK7_9BACL
MKKQLILLFAAALILLSGCGNGNNENDANQTSEHSEEHSEMNHSSTGEVPEQLEPANSPTFPIGSQAVIQANHMEGMNGATATITGAFDTTVYAVSYTPTTGGKRITNHKWIIHEEIQHAGDQPYEPGTDVVLNADHMEGMLGATAIIDSAEQTTVYMVDYTPTTDGEPVKNHKWVTERELNVP